MRDYKEIINIQGFFIIAEVGVNYYDIAKKEKLSLIEAAKLMIKNAKENGADAVKFQSYKAETIVSKQAPAYWDLKEESTPSQYELFKKYDKFEESDYITLSNYCKNEDIIFMSTPFDFKTVDFLDKIVSVFKISSSDITNIPFIEYIAKKNKPIFLSTGAATLGEIERAIQVIRNYNKAETTLLHCVLDYPTKYSNSNLNMIKHLQQVFPDVRLGYSDHTKPNMRMLVPTIAYLYGATIIEKHFTLDKALPGNDHYHAMDPQDLKILRENLTFANEVSGEYYKRPLECEEASRKQARRSIIAQVDIKKGEIITIEKLAFKRPGTGIPPLMLDHVIGGTALENIKKDEIIKFDQIKFTNNEVL